MFKVLDEVTGKLDTYLGMYTLRVIAGGVTISDMTRFDPDTNMYVWYQIEAKLNNYIY